MTARFTRRSARTLTFAALAAAAAATVGCNAPYSSATHDAFVSNPTPTLDGITDRSVDIRNRIAITNDTNLRILQEDLMVFSLFDRPRRTTKFPIPY